MKIFRVGKDFLGRILERIGPFSRMSTVPFFAEVFLTRRKRREAWPTFRGVLCIIASTSSPIEEEAWKSSSTWEISGFGAAET